MITVWETTRVSFPLEQENEQEIVVEENLSEEVAEKPEEEIEKPRRKERVFWRDVFGGTYID